jgi:alkanesulfonate monooxygenase SsuD/methylene tetrahydromethanopterin reductase-like flavin-dependent oxidoreductase (luciferase family)
MPGRKLWFGFSPAADVATASGILRCAARADRAGLDLLAVSDHPYCGSRLDAYAALGAMLGRTARIAGAVTVTNLPARPAPVLARTITSLSAISGDGWCWESARAATGTKIVRLTPRLTPAGAVRAMEEAITLIRTLSGGGAPVTFNGEFYQVTGLDPAAVPAPPIWTGAVGPRSLAVTGRLADGWIPGHSADWLSPRYRLSRAVIDDAAAAAGRDPARIATIFNLPAHTTTAPLAAPRDRTGRRAGGSVRQRTHELTAAILEHGADGFVYFAPDATTADMALGRWAEEIVPAVREAIRQT